MALVAQDVHFHYSGAGSSLGSQPDPNASLGGYIASAADRLYHSEAAVTSVTNDHHIVVSAFIGQDYTDDWILVISGSAILLAAKIIDMSSGSGDIWLSHPLTGIGATDYIRVHSMNNLFDSIGAAEAQDGENEYRGIYLRNETTITLTAIRMTLAPVFAGNPEIAIAFGDVSNNNMGSIANEDTEPDLAVSLPDNDARFETISNFLLAYPWAGGASFVDSTQRPIWVRRNVPALSGQQDDIVWLIAMVATNPLASAALIVFDGDGFDIDLAVQEDRHAYIGGGARLEATVLSDSGVPLEEYGVEWELTGDGSIDAATGATDENGQYSAAYTCPTDQAKVGQSATITAKVL